MAEMPDPKGVRSLLDGEKWLKKLTKHHIDKIVFPSGLNAMGSENIHKAIKLNIDGTAFSKQNMFEAVEQRCTWTATRSDGQKIFKLEVNFNADKPLVDSPHPLHYGYDISLDGNRVAGPGHVNFDKDVILRYYRLGTDADSLLEEHEIVSEKGLLGSGYLEYKAILQSFSIHAMLNSILGAGTTNV